MPYRCGVESVDAQGGSTSGSPAICPAHVEDHVLREHITTHAALPSCSYCSAVGSASRPIAVTLDVFIDAFMIGVGVHHQPHPSPTTDAPLVDSVDSSDVAREILQIAGISHRELVDDVVGSLSTTPNWLPRDYKNGSPIEQLTYSWEAFKHLVKHEMRYFFGSSRHDWHPPGWEIGTPQRASPMRPAQRHRDAKLPHSSRSDPAGRGRWREDARSGHGAGLCCARPHANATAASCAPTARATRVRTSRIVLLSGKLAFIVTPPGL